MRHCPTMAVRAAILTIATGLALMAGAASAADTTAATAAPRAPERLFIEECGICHLKGGTGTLMLDRRLGADRALLAERPDLEGDYVRTVVRNGLNSMPAITRVEVTDEELSRIIAYLTRHGEGKTK